MIRLLGLTLEEAMAQMPLGQKVNIIHTKSERVRGDRSNENVRVVRALNTQEGIELIVAAFIDMPNNKD